MIHSPLSEDNFLLYAIKIYNNPYCRGMNEFYEDLNRIKYIKRLFNKYETKRILKNRLLLNHLIILNNIRIHCMIRYNLLKTFITLKI